MCKNGLNMVNVCVSSIIMNTWDVVMWQMVLQFVGLLRWLRTYEQ